MATTTAAQQSAKGYLDAQLHAWGLDTLADFAWNSYKKSGSTDIAMLDIEGTSQYKERFAGKLSLNAKGIEMSEGEQLAWESQAQGLMRAAGMPSGFYDNWQDFSKLIQSGISVTELGERVNNAFAAVSQAPQAVRDAFAQFYGDKGDNALASMALDTTVALPIIQRHVAAAEAGGFLAQQNFQVTKTIAEQIAEATGNSLQAIQSGSQQIGKLTAAGIDQSRFNENAPDQNAFIGAAFEGDQAAQAEIQRTIDTRQASTSGGEQIDSSRYGAAGLGEAGRF
jgi:hypothetical protein